MSRVPASKNNLGFQALDIVRHLQLGGNAQQKNGYKIEIEDGPGG
jgi:hypothetical protein